MSGPRKVRGSRTWGKKGAYHKSYRTLHDGEGYITCPHEKQRIINEFIEWLTHEQENVVGMRHGAVFYAPRSIRGTEESPIGQWVRKNTPKRKSRNQSSY